MTTADTSVLIAGFDSTHPFFARAAAALGAVRRDGRLVAHTISETFAVLSAPASPYPAGPQDVMAYLEPFLGRDPVGIAADRYPAAVSELASLGIVGGAVYDGLIAIAARDNAAELMSLDVRAARTYEQVGVRHQLLIDTS